MALRKAERRKAKIRIGLSGPSGSGKTFSALLIARGMASSWDKIALIDTERGSGDLYCHLGDYNVLPLDADFTPEKYIEAIRTCEKAGMEVIIIDSISHEWDGKGGLLESNEILASAKFKGNTWSAWSQTTPRHQKFIEAITSSTCHVIACGRSKTDTVLTDGKVKKVGMKEITRDGFEYEMTLGFALDRDKHYATTSKDRTGLFIDLDPFVITEETGKTIMEWCESGAEVTPSPASPPAVAPAAKQAPAVPPPSAKDLEKIEELMRIVNLTEAQKEATRKKITKQSDAEVILAALLEKNRLMIESLNEEVTTPPAEVIEGPVVTPEEPTPAETMADEPDEASESQQLMLDVKALIVPDPNKTPLVQLNELFAQYCGTGITSDNATLLHWRVVHKVLKDRVKAQQKEVEAPATIEDVKDIFGTE